MAKIKPCPFCGMPAEPKLINGAWKISCNTELCASHCRYISKDFAITEWNRRMRQQKKEDTHDHT